MIDRPPRTTASTAVAGVLAGLAVAAAASAAPEELRYPMMQALDGREAIAASGEEGERRAIEEILARDRRAHLETNAQLMAGHLADSLVEVSDGAVAIRTRAEIIDFFTSNFDGATFHQWEDTEPPTIRLSPDLAMAWVVRRVTAEREDLRDGDPVRTRYTSAYTATYEKHDGRWRMTSVTSTFLPPG